VRLRDLESGRRHQYELVGTFESDPGCGRISSESPLGRAILGRRRGDVAVVDTPRGRFRYRIVAVEPPFLVA
jgi:transcription elongation factor GreA